MIRNLLRKFLTPVHYCSVDTEPIDGDNDAQQQLCRLWFRIKCIDVIPPPLLSKAPRKNALGPLNGGCPLSTNWSSLYQQLCSTNRLVCERAFCTFFLQIQVPGMTNECSLGNDAAYAATSEEFATQISLFPLSPQSMSLCIDMKMIRSLMFFGPNIVFLHRFPNFLR